ncbi:MAG TPA: hypothetical protein PKE64_17515 [Anaerolineae bacterium]|nr:hypothetical protein [Anaerolineae bacterium]HMR65809.1 hypothetical protein [Anaerolineae bacterium]
MNGVQEQKAKEKTTHPPRWTFRFILLAVILATVFFRLWRLSELPPGVWWDEAYNAMDSLWMVQSGSPQIYFVGNNGREPMFHYLSGLMMTAFSALPFSFRLTAAFVGILTIPLAFVWIKSLFIDHPDRYWLAIIGAGGLSFSMWHVVLSRSGFRAVLIPLFFILMSLLFWLGWRKRSPGHFLLSGIMLGLSQYTYVVARLFPIVFILFTLAWVVVSNKRRVWKNSTNNLPAGGLLPNLVKHLGFRIVSSQTGLRLGLFIMVVGAAIIFAPLGLFFIYDPHAFFASANAAADSVNPSLATLPTQLAESFYQVFIAGYDHNWRHGIVGYNGLGYLNFVGFWLGLIITVRRIRQPVYLFLFISLIVLWVPITFSDRPHMLRLSGLMPVYYAITGVGSVAFISWLSSLVGEKVKPTWLLPIAFGLLFAANATLTFYAYFVRWAAEPNVYEEYDGPISDFVLYLIDESTEKDIILPFSMYALPTTRMLLFDSFREEMMPVDFVPKRPALLITTPNSHLAPRMDRVKDSAYVWLTRQGANPGLAYVSRSHWPATDWLELTSNLSKTPYQLLNGQTGAYLMPVSNTTPLLPAFLNWPEFVPTNLRIDNQIRLVGYQVTPNPVQPGQTMILDLYWQDFELPWQYWINLDITDIRGSHIGKWKSFPEGFFRWRQNTLVRTQDLLYISADIMPGLYLIKLSLVDQSGRLASTSYPDQTTTRDHITLGAFFVSKDDLDPRLPPIELVAELGVSVRLLGYSPIIPLGDNVYRTKLYWQATKDISQDFTFFVRLLDSQKQTYFTWEFQPVNGQYPTSQWKAGEIIVDDFDLVLPNDLVAGEYFLITGISDLISDTNRVSASAENSEPYPNSVTLTRFSIP